MSCPAVDVLIINKTLQHNIVVGIGDLVITSINTVYYLQQRGRRGQWVENSHRHTFKDNTEMWKEGE